MPITYYYLKTTHFLLLPVPVLVQGTAVLPIQSLISYFFLSAVRHHGTVLLKLLFVFLFFLLFKSIFFLENFRLHLFGRDSTIRPGWLTVGPMLTNSNFNADTYCGYFASGNVTGCTERIEALRPKSPPPKGNKGSSGGANRGRGGFSRGASRGRGR